MTKCIVAVDQTETDPPDPAFGYGTDCIPSPEVRIGDLVWFKVVVTLPSGVPNGDFGAASMTDSMDLGLTFLECLEITASNVSTDFAGGFDGICGTLGNPGITFNAPSGNLSNTQQVVTFNLGNVTSTGGTLTFVYTAAVLDNAENVEGLTLNDEASFASGWGNLGPASASMAIIEPQMTITKTVSTGLITAVGETVTYTITVTHPAADNVSAYNVVMYDILPPEVDYANALSLVNAADPAGTCVFNAPVLPAWPSGRIYCSWDLFPAGKQAVITFNVTGNALMVPGTPVTNVAFLEWTSLPGFPQPTTWNANPFSTERYFDPGDPTINNYGTNSSIPLNIVGEGGGCKKDCFEIPVTGFAPGVVTELQGQPEVPYMDNMAVRLEIPKLRINMPIVGVPLVKGDWQVDWLTGVGGWLQGTAFPGLSGNSVITSHVVTRTGSDGPFARLGTLSVGDRIYITAFSRRYVYEVTSVGNVSPNDIGVFKHESKSVITLITCSKYNETTGAYDGRLVVTTKLIQVSALK